MNTLNDCPLPSTTDLSSKWGHLTICPASLLVGSLHPIQKRFFSFGAQQTFIHIWRALWVYFKCCEGPRNRTITMWRTLFLKERIKIEFATCLYVCSVEDIRLHLIVVTINILKKKVTLKFAMAFKGIIT